eukprot:6726188-Prymnesium_polylepis.1
MAPRPFLIWQRWRDSTLIRAKLGAKGLAREQLVVLVGMLRASPLGAAQGCAAVWLAARAGAAAAL